MGRVTDEYQSRVKAGRIDKDPSQIAVLPELDRIAEALSAPARRGLFRKGAEPVKGLYLWGGVGRGKSMLMDLLVDCATGPLRRVHFHAFMQEVHEGMHKARESGIEDALRPVIEKLAGDLRLLAFDEMQITDITDAMIVGRLFEGLFARGVAVVTTSNRPPDELYKDGLNRQLFLPFIGLLKERLVVRELDSKIDYRQGRLSDGQTYFTPNNEASRREIDAIWRDFSGGEAAPLTLTVKGRAVTLPAFRNGVARMSFYELCGQPFGPADYLAIAEELKVLILEDIPCLGRSNFNEAKRFVILIDALYEAKVRLIASAEAAPDLLYLEGEGSFEFERTASRLKEMQATDWGQ